MPGHGNRHNLTVGQENHRSLPDLREVSPSGGGAKLFFVLPQADPPAIDRLFEGNGGKVFRIGGGEHGPAIEVYRFGRYFTVTDESIGPTDILRQVSLADLEWLIRDAGPRFAHKESQKSGSGNDQSRSGKAFRKGAALKAAGHSYDAMRDALLVDADPEIAEWARTKGLANGEREMHRIYDNAGNADARPNGEDSSFTPIIAKSYIYRDPRSIPPRQFLHASHYIRGFLSATIAPGGLGKTSLQLVEAMGMAVGRDLLTGTTSPGPLKVWYWNLEGPRDETDRRIAAILLHYKIDPAKIEGHLFINSEEPLVIATRIRDATVVAEPVVNGLMSEITRIQIDALIIDPFVSSHKVPENDNGAIDVVAKTGQKWPGRATAPSSLRII